MCSTVRKRLCQVIRSKSKCIYENLAYEEHLLRTHDPEEDGDVLLLWSNQPSVVVGRHQNPWVEVNLEEAERRGVRVVRRHSGGGTVYHDEGNLNLSILTTQKDHCRRRNLEWISKVINRRYSVNVVPTHRDDLEMQPGQRKCSGTAARISRGRAYHHMTMLVQVDLSLLSTLLRSPIESRLESTATRSVRAPAVGYLRQDDERVTVDGLAETIVAGFEELFEDSITRTEDVTRDTVTIPTVTKALEELTSWEWIYGKTPPFKVKETNVEVKAGKFIQSGKPFHACDIDR